VTGLPQEIGEDERIIVVTRSANSSHPWKKDYTIDEWIDANKNDALWQWWDKFYESAIEKPGGIQRYYSSSLIIPGCLEDKSDNVEIFVLPDEELVHGQEFLIELRGEEECLIQPKTIIVVITQKVMF
jgi:hypothetical protein